MLKAQNAAMITRLYILFLGLLMSLFIGVGIAAFYHGPAAPTYPTILERGVETPAGAPQDTSTKPQFDKAQRTYDEDQKAFTKKNNEYQRNVSLLALAGALLLVLLGLTALKAVPIINDSLLLGGVFTLVYSIMRGFGAGDDAFRFMLVTASLVIAVTLGYLKLIKPMQSSAKTKRKS
jgi:hypothetical protein